MLRNQFEKIRHNWMDRSILSWPSPEEELEQSKSESHKQLELWFRDETQIPKEKQLFNHRKNTWLVVCVLIRKTFYYIAVVIAFSILAFPLLLLFCWPYLDQPLRYNSPSSIPFWALGSIAFGIVLKLQLGGYRSSKTIKYYLSDDLSEEEKDRVERTYHKIKEGSAKICVKTKNGIFREISEPCLSAENLFLLFTEKLFYRYGIVLSGWFLNGEIFYAGNPTPYTRNTRDFSIQRKYLAPERIESTYNKIDAVIDYILINGKKVTSNGRVRFAAMKYALDNPEFWSSPDRNKYLSDHPETKAALLNIFKLLSRTRSTLDDKSLGETQMYDFIDLKDRSLENFLRELIEQNII